MSPFPQQRFNVGDTVYFLSGKMGYDIYQCRVQDVHLTRNATKATYRLQGWVDQVHEAQLFLSFQEATVRADELFRKSESQ